MLRRWVIHCEGSAEGEMLRKWVLLHIEWVGYIESVKLG